MFSIRRDKEEIYGNLQIQRDIFRQTTQITIIWPLTLVQPDVKIVACESPCNHQFYLESFRRQTRSHQARILLVLNEESARFPQKAKTVLNIKQCGFKTDVLITISTTIFLCTHTVQRSQLKRKGSGFFNTLNKTRNPVENCLFK